MPDKEGRSVYEVSITAHFSAAHRLKGYRGACAAVHGHNWEVEVFVRGERLNRTGILMDFRKLKEAVRQAVATLDHADLNSLPAFRAANPTSENIARLLYERLAPRLTRGGRRLARVRVRETPGSAAGYAEDGATP